MPDGGEEQSGQDLEMPQKSWQGIVERRFLNQGWDDRVTGRFTTLEVYTLECGLVGVRPCDAQTGETAYGSRVPVNVSKVDLGDGWHLSQVAALDVDGKKNTISFLENEGLARAQSGQQVGVDSIRSEIQLDREGTPVRVVGKRDYQVGLISVSVEITLSTSGDNSALIRLSQDDEKLNRRVDFEFGTDGQLKRVRLASNDFPKQPNTAVETDFFGGGRKDYREWAGESLKDPFVAEVVSRFLGFQCERADLARLDLETTLKNSFETTDQSDARAIQGYLAFVSSQQKGMP